MKRSMEEGKQKLNEDRYIVMWRRKDPEDLKKRGFDPEYPAFAPEAVKKGGWTKGREFMVSYGDFETPRDRAKAHAAKLEKDDGERVEYKTFGNKSLSGLSTGAIYYVGVIDNKNLKLYTSLNGAIAGVGTTGFTDYGEGNHALRSLNGKAVVGTIQVTNPGSGYENKRRTLQPVGVDTALNIIKVTDHE